MGNKNIKIPDEKIMEFCRKWNIRRFSLFGSVFTEHFRDGSDIDVLVTFDDGSQHTLFDLVRMEDELKQIFGCEVDLVSRRGLESSRNYIRKNAILNSAELIYATG